MQSAFERIAYEAALRSLDKQERLVEELRARSGLIMAGASVAASLLGQQAFRHHGPGVLTAIALMSFVVVIGASVAVLAPRRDLTFAQAGRALYEELHPIRSNMPEVLRRLTYEMTAFWTANDATIARLAHLQGLAAAALIVEILALATLLGATIV